MKRADGPWSCARSAARASQGVLRAAVEGEGLSPQDGVETPPSRATIPLAPSRLGARVRQRRT